MSLISAADLAARLDDPSLRIADVRWSLAAPAAGRAAYAEAHLPGAVFVDLDTVLTAAVGPGRHPLPDPAAFVAALGALGIGREHRVVAYDDAGGTVAARLWWMLDVLGHRAHPCSTAGSARGSRRACRSTADVPALRGGGRVDRPAARVAAHDLSRRARPAPRLARPPRRPGAGALPGRDRADRPGRRPHPDRGERTDGVLPRAGRTVPRARRARRALRGPRGGRQAGRNRERPVVVACGSGVNACQLALAMRAAGLPDPLLYPGSYSDWSRSGMPIATGDSPAPTKGQRAGASLARSSSRRS